MDNFETFVSRISIFTDTNNEVFGRICRKGEITGYNSQGLAECALDVEITTL